MLIKNTLSITLALLAFSTGLTAQTPAIKELAAPAQPKRAVWYIQVGGGAVSASEDAPLSPGITIGRRWETDSTAVDVSLKWMGSEGHDSHVGYFALPRVMALKYLTPDANSSLFIGGGASIGVMGRSDKSDFAGVMGDAVLGYEFNRSSTTRSMLQLELNQGLLSFNHDKGLGSPTVSVNFGIGF